MAELHPSPLPILLGRALRERRARGAIFDLPEKRFWRAGQGPDLGVDFHGERAETPVGPAAGPHSQLAQNIALSWLAGARVIELKTVQVDDHLVIPRPCIDARTVGYNIEWSQELKVEQSLEEYVAAWMLIRILNEELKLGAMPLFDMSVGYDLAGIRTDKVRRFIRGLMDATPTIARLRDQLTGPLARYRDLDFDPAIASCITLSTFHGCPSDEIESIVEFLLAELGTHVVIKMNPTQLGYEAVSELLHDRLGYTEVRLDQAAFDHDLKWDEAQQLVERLDGVARARGLTLGVKYSNTLVVKNDDPFFSEPTKYLSGPPLHVLAMLLAARFRERFGERFAISFSAGIDRRNFPDAALAGLVPVTTCTDLLRAGGYGRLPGYLEALSARLDKLGAADLEQGILAAALGLEEGALDAALAGGRRAEALAAARALNLRRAAEAAAADPRYRAEHNARPPRKIGRALKLFDCINCDKCIAVCPNDANFYIETAPLVVEDCPILELRAGQAVVAARERYEIAAAHQLANYADFCNECGNCDVFCPEDGGPYVVKPRFFAARHSFLESPHLDGFWIERAGEDLRMEGRIAGRVYRLQRSPGRPDLFDDGALACEIEAGALLSARPFFKAAEGHRLPLWRYHAMSALLDAALADDGCNPISARIAAGGREGVGA